MIPAYFWLFSASYLALLYITWRRWGWTILNIFAVGFLLMYIIGPISISLDASHAYMLGGDGSRVLIVLPEIVMMGICMMLALRFQRDPGADITCIEAGQFRKVNWRILAFPALGYLAVAALFIPWSKAPLFNIGTYGLDQMAQARMDFYRPDFLVATNVLRYLVFYVICPVIFLQRGLGVRVPLLVLGILTFFGLMTLAKTFFVLNFSLWALGGFLRNGKLLPFMARVSVILGGFFWIVRSVYLSDLPRNFIEVMGVLFARIIQIPVVCSVLYAENFRFSDGIRTSFWYQIFFGGQVRDISGDLMWVLAHRDGSAPAGIIGNCYPNIPPFIYPFYFGAVVLFVYAVSQGLARRRDNLFKVVMTIILGIISWFICTTDVLTVMNSYGFLYLSVLALLLSKARLAAGTTQRARDTPSGPGPVGFDAVVH